MTPDFDTIVIGAGPAGSVAAALLAQRGHRVCVIERSHFPRFAVGESMLPYSLDILHEAGLLEAVEQQGFQRKSGVLFNHSGNWLDGDFARAGGRRAQAYNVERAVFDDVLIRRAQQMGVQVRFGETVLDFGNAAEVPILQIRQESGKVYEITAGFLLDASGYFHAVPRLLGWDRQPSQRVRQVHFSHIDDHIDPAAYDRRKNIVLAHPKWHDVWFSLVPLNERQSSVSVFAPPERFDGLGTSEHILRHYAEHIPVLSQWLRHAVWQNGFPFYFFPGYSSSVKALHGRHFALLGNSGEFIDPLFSSGVAAAVHSAKLAAGLVDKTLNGQTVDWPSEFDAVMAVGNHVFQTLIEAWYNGTFQQVWLEKQPDDTIIDALCAILAGYAWDHDNPYVRTAARHRSATFAEIISILEQEDPHLIFQAA